MPTPLHFVFQGGGAKLGCLVAVADAIFESAEKLDYEIRSVSGTSAGAIVACMLATGEHPKQFRAILRRLAPSYLPRIVKKRNYINAAWAAWRGTPLYDTSAYVEFLEKIFSDDLLNKKYTHLSKLDPRIKFFLHAVDIGDRKPKTYSAGGDDQPIPRVLLDSSGIPFVFRTFKESSSTSLVDGGIIDNLPVDSVMSKLSELNKPQKTGYVIGVSFAPDGVKWTFKNVFEYVKALVSTAIDNPVQQSIRKLDLADIHFIQTKTSTFDFVGALKQDLGDKYDGYKERANAFLEKSILRKRLTISPELLIDRTRELHTAYMARQQTRIKRVRLVATCNCLTLPWEEAIGSNPRLVDSMDMMVDVEPIGNWTLTHGLGFTMDNRAAIEIGDVNVSVKSNGTTIETTVLPIPPRLVSDHVASADLLLFFHEPLKPGHSYAVEVRSQFSSILTDLVDPKKKADEILYQNVNHEMVETAELIAYIPINIPDPELVDRAGKAPWKTGAPMHKSELPLAPPGFKAIGWKAKDVRRGETTGFMAKVR
jgi:hypothetical protein